MATSDLIGVLEQVYLHHILFVIILRNSISRTVDYVEQIMTINLSNPPSFPLLACCLSVFSLQYHGEVPTNTQCDIRDAILKQLEDKSVEVQTVAVKWSVSLFLALYLTLHFSLP